SAYRTKAPRGIILLSARRDDPTSSPYGDTFMLSDATAHQPTENGAAEPQSIETNRSQWTGMAKGDTTCLAVDQQSKNAPSMAFQSPSSHALTSAALPDARRRCT